MTYASNKDIEIGTVFANVWGYGMRLPYFAKVVGKKGKCTVTVVEMKTNDDYFDKKYRQGEFLATPTDVECGQRHDVKLREGYMGQICIPGMHRTAYVWDGQPLRCNDLD